MVHQRKKIKLKNKIDAYNKWVLLRIEKLDVNKLLKIMIDHAYQKVVVKKPANSSEFAKQLSEAPKKLKSLLPPNKNVTKIDPASRKLSMTNVRRSTMSQKNRAIEEMNDYLLKRKNIKGVKKQNTKK